MNCIGFLRLFSNMPYSSCNVSSLGFTAFHCFGVVVFEIQETCRVTSHRALPHLLQLPLHTTPSHGHFPGYVSCESAQVSGRDPPCTMLAPNSSQLRLSPVACPRTASPQIFPINAHQIPDSTLNNQDHSSQCITNSTTSVKTYNIQSGITFFPEYTPACTPTLRIQELVQQLLESICRRRTTPKTPLNGHTSPLGPSTVSATLCEATASLGILPVAIASGDAAPPS